MSSDQVLAAQSCEPSTACVAPVVIFATILGESGQARAERLARCYIVSLPRIPL
jgi:hypothetical protein